jgi:hypothetical protein
MPDKNVLDQARKDLREGKSPSTAAGEFVREEIKHVREGIHGVRSPQQAIAIGLSEARRAGIPLRPPKQGKVSDETRERAQQDYQTGQTAPVTAEEGSTTRGKARLNAMKKEPRNTVSHAALSRHAKSAASTKHT